MVDGGDEDEQNAGDDGEIKEASGEEAKRATSDSTSLIPIVQAGKWGICSFLAMLIPATAFLFLLDQALQPIGTPAANPDDVEPELSAFSRASGLTILFFVFLS